MRHKNSLVRKRAIAILADNARWDREGKFDTLLDEFLSHVTDAKPITARQCMAALPEIAEAKPKLVLRIRAALEQAGLSNCKAMEPHLARSVYFTTCTFGEWKGGKVIEKGPQCKMARGQTVRWMAD